MQTQMTCYFLHYRFKKMVLSQTPGGIGGPGGPLMGGNGVMGPAGSKDPMEVSLRPQTMANNMMFKPKTPSMLPKSAISKTTDGSSPLGENSLLGKSHKRSMFQDTTISRKNDFLLIGKYKKIYTFKF